MAKIVFGQGVSKMSGRMGGTVFASNRGGSYARNFVVPINPASSYQSGQRQKIGNVSAAWRSLTAAQQAAWVSWAGENPITDRLGASITLSGHQAYVSVNVLRQLASDSAVASTPPGVPSYVADALDAEYKTLDLSDTKIEPEAKAILPISTIWFCYASPPVSPGVTYTFDREKLVQVVTLGAEVAIGAALANLWTNYTTRFGALTGKTGNKIITRVRQYDEGQLGTAYAISGVLAA